MEAANANRTTHATVANDTSSRSHAICQVFQQLDRFTLEKEMTLQVSWCWSIWQVVSGLKILKVTIDREEQREHKLTKGMIDIMQFAGFEVMYQSDGR